MSKHTVHVFATVRCTFNNVEADSQEDAIRKVTEVDNMDEHLSTADDAYVFDNVQYCLVDNEGDEEFEHSRWYDADLQLIPPGQEVL